MAKPTESPERDDDSDDERDRRVTNVFLLVMFVIVVGAGLWLANAMVDYRNVDNCIAQGRRDCGRIDVDTAR